MPGASEDGNVLQSGLRARGIIAERRLSSASRIRNKSDFQRIQGGGKRVYCKHFLLLMAEPPAQVCRLGLVVSRRVDKRATRRNRLKRRLREIFRLNSQRFIKPCDLVIVARADAGTCAYQEIESEILRTLHAKGFIGK